MEPFSSLISGHVAGKLMDCIQSRFRTHVVERWTKRRAERFFEEFCHEVELELAGKKSDKLDELLAHILEDETCFEVLFDAYRRVSFTKSKNLGPRLIGIITAQLVIEERLANQVEDNMLLAAESLTDDELLDFSKFVQKRRVEAEAGSRNDVSYSPQGDLQIRLGEEQSFSHWPQESDISLAPLDLVECLGRWAAKLKAFGIISDDVKEHQWDYEEDSEQ